MNINIDELSKLAFEEVQKELNAKENAIQEEAKAPIIVEEIIQNDDIKISENNEKSTISKYEKAYLKKIRERILVLFEALNAKQDDESLEQKVEITIGFIEFLLASIEDRIKD